MGNTKKNEGGKLLILQYNPSDGGRESWLSVAGERVKNGQNSDLQLVSVIKGDDVVYEFNLLRG